MMPPLPPPDPSNLAGAAERAGAEIVAIDRDARGTRIGRFEVRDTWQSAQFLANLSTAEDLRDPTIVALGQTARARLPDPIDCAAALQKFVQRRVRFQREDPETFQSPRETLRRGFGDCDDSSRLLVALARAARLPARFAFLVVGSPPQPVHVYAEIGLSGRWIPAETTIAAELGEDPRNAAARLGVRRRPDLESAAIVRLEGLAGLAGLGAVSADLTASGTWTVPPNARVRVVLESGFATTDEAIRAQFLAMGFSVTLVTRDVGDLTLEWPTQDLARAQLGFVHVFVEGTYTRAKKGTFARELAIGHVLRAVRFGWGPSSTDANAPSAPSAPTAPNTDPNAPVDQSVASRTPDAPIDLSTLPDPPSDDDTPPPQTTAANAARVRGRWARAVLLSAWRATRPNQPITERQVRAILAVSMVETLLASATAPAKNWGFEVATSKGPPCPPGSFAHSDTHQGKPVQVCFRTYPTHLEACARWLDVLLRGDVPAALGNPGAMAIAMAKNNYYEHTDADGSESPEKVSRYAGALAGSLSTLGAALDADPTPALVLAAAALLAGAMYLTHEAATPARKGRR